ncbi:phosphoglucosamine mutase [Hansschlegelia plantiphila]|uniref:Phosphoglucosamine mutase n=1 Tax=Hansschlegelia plantiphila TaxID=374655 RepID=A0A9W6MUD2_9HYPH|nr:phosphoglucosamine mutase [Hansschlegelia plantiphila]GLK67269.1 phosphoglucosamine mutase [Hansschlegelia plantiphila]
MTRKYFGTDGIRGRANKFPITPDFAMKVGMAAGIAFRRGDHRHRVVIGKDTRLSGYMIESALQAGFTSVGVNVLLVGPMPTPAVALLTRSMRADLGVMISASHNPYDDNGIKLFAPDGYKLSDEVELEIEALLDSDLGPQLADSAALGRAKRIDDAQARYIEFAKRTIQRNLSLEGLRIVIDCANGAAYKVAPEALWELGADVVAIGVEPNGVNINKDVGSTAPAALVDKVRETRADIGIALDGDADRVIIVDEKGQIVDGDQLMAVVAQSWSEQGRLSAPGLVSTVMSNLGFERYLTSIGLTLERTPVGDRYVVERMRAQGYNLGGEPSGHIVLSDYATTGDGLVAALQLLAVVQQAGKPVSEICHRFEPLPQILKNVRYKSGRPLDDAKVRAAISHATDRLGLQGRLVIRPSGTEPVIRVMAEGDDRDLVANVVDDVVDVITRAAA